MELMMDDRERGDIKCNTGNKLISLHRLCWRVSQILK
jgi:hypothetical protein